MFVGLLRAHTEDHTLMPLPSDHPADEFFEIAIENPDSEPQPLAELEVEAPESPGVTRAILLSEGGKTRSDPSKRVETQGNEEQTHQVLVTPESQTAIGIFLNTVEQHGAAEESTIESLQAMDNVDFATYDNWRSTLTQEERQERLLTDGQSRRDRSPHVETYIEEGSWRTVEATDTARSIGTKLWEGIDTNPRRCYRNTILGLKAANGHDRVQYVEGLALPKQGGRAVAHAWLEVDDVVIELTWPWHAPLPPTETVYYGVPVPTQEVFETTERRNAGFNPILLSDDAFTQDVRQQAKPV